MLDERVQDIRVNFEAGHQVLATGGKIERRWPFVGRVQ